MDPHPSEYDEISKRNRMYKMLDGVPDHIKRKFQWDDEAVWSFTDLRIARSLCQKLLTLPGISSSSQITDGTASVGGNTIAFAETFAHVNSIELNLSRFGMLNHNINLMKLGAKVTTYNSYMQEHIYDPVDIVFFDPPWGKDYKKYAAGELRLSMSGPFGDIDTVESIINSLSGYTKYVVVKLPINYDIVYLDAETKKTALCVYTESHGRPNTSLVKVFHMFTDQ